MPYVYGYCRVSSRDQADHGHSLEVQQEILRKYYENHLSNAEWSWGGIYQDAAVSASIPFFDRPIGGKLDKMLKKGDQVVSVRLDRMFRSMRDMVNTLHVWHTRGVQAKLLDINLDTTTAVGEAMLHMMGTFAQFFRRQLSERIKESMHKGKARMDATRRPINAPYGFRYTTDANRKVMVPDYEERYWMGMAHDLVVNAGKSYYEIWQLFKQWGAPARDGRQWTIMRICYAYRRELKLRQQERVLLHHKPRLDVQRVEAKRTEGTFCADKV